MSVNQTLSRTILTSGLTFLTALSLFLFGGQVLNGFAFRAGGGYYCGHVLVDFHCESDPDLLAELCGMPEEGPRAPAAVERRLKEAGAQKAVSGQSERGTDGAERLGRDRRTLPRK